MTYATPCRAHAPALRSGRSLPPRDRAVPQLPRLLNRERMTAALERCVRAGSAIEDLRVAFVDYRPGSGASVTYDVGVGGRRHVAVAATGDALSSQAARTDARRAIARALGRDATVARPLSYDVGLGALLHWYPLDLAMPVLARPVGEVLRLAARAGIDTGDAPEDGRTLLYRPGRRAVLRVGDVVLKAYADEAAFRAGVDGLRLAGGLRLDAAPRSCGALPDLRVTLQRAVDGVPVARSRAHAVAPIAGSMLRVLHDAAVPGLDPAPPERMLAAAARATALVGAVAPHAGRRARRLLARLEERTPPAGAPVASHGDFNISQLLDVNGALAVVDFDEACFAPPAADLAGYAANLVSGRPGDLAAAEAALAALLDGYGARPADLDWHLAAAVLCRAPSPFRLHKRRWSQRVEAIVVAAEEVLGR